MGAASARAISSPRNPATRQGLERAVAWSRQWSAEFPFFLANHLPMVLIALHRMGASDERLEAYCQIYHKQNGLVPVPERIEKITRGDWREFLGRREREGDYRSFFAGEVERLGASAAVAPYLPELLPGVAASAAHGLMRWPMRRCATSERRGAALGYWAATYLALGASHGARAVDRRSGRSARRMRAVESFRHVEIELDLLWHFMRAVAAKPEFARRRRLARHRPRHICAGAARFAGALCRDDGFLRAARADRLPLAAADRAGDARARPRAALFLAGDRGARPEDRLPRHADRGEPRGVATAALPRLARHQAAAVTSDDEHDLSLVFSARRGIEALSATGCIR